MSPSTSHQFIQRKPIQTNSFTYRVPVCNQSAVTQHIDPADLSNSQIISKLKIPLKNSKVGHQNGDSQTVFGKSKKITKRPTNRIVGKSLFEKQTKQKKQK